MHLDFENFNHYIKKNIYSIYNLQIFSLQKNKKFNLNFINQTKIEEKSENFLLKICHFNALTQNSKKFYLVKNMAFYVRKGAFLLNCMFLIE